MFAMSTDSILSNLLQVAIWEDSLSGLKVLSDLLTRSSELTEFQELKKSGYKLHRTVLENADIAKIINSNEVQSVVRQARTNEAHHVDKRNPLRNEEAMDKLNPYGAVLRRMEKESQEFNKKKRQDALAQKRGITKSLSKEQKTALKARKKASQGWIKGVLKNLDDAYEGEE